MRGEDPTPANAAFVETTTILGTGSLGTALGILLTRCNWPLAGIWSRSHDRALTASLHLGCNAFPEPDEPVSQASLVLLTVSDRAVQEVFERIRPCLRPGTLVVHTSGSLGPEVLDTPLALAMHPLQSVPNPEAGVERLPGSVFTLQGSPEALERGLALVQAVGGRPLTLSAVDRNRYHAAATLISTSLVASFAVARDLWPQEGALEALMPLARGTLTNLAERGPEASLTGPAVRQDWATVASHWQSLTPDARDFYRAVIRTALHHTRQADLARLEEVLRT